MASVPLHEVTVSGVSPVATKGSGAERETEAASSGGGRSQLERVTVNLTPRASRALERAVEITGDTKTDTINRALQVYAYLESIMQADGSVYVRPGPDAEQERLRIF
jgi:hypothetical protein